MSQTHSPGPWHTNANYPNLVNGPKEAPGVLVDCSKYVDEPEAFANAKLIAAAPELLDSIKKLLRSPELHQDNMDEYTQFYIVEAHAAIAKATR